MQLAVIEVLYQKQDIEREIDQQFDEVEQSDIEDDFSESISCKDDDFSESISCKDDDFSESISCKDDDFSESISCKDDDFYDNELVDLDASHNKHRGNKCDITEVSCGPKIKKVPKLIVVFRRSPKKKIPSRSMLRLNLGRK